MNVEIEPGIRLDVDFEGVDIVPGSDGMHRKPNLAPVRHLIVTPDQAKVIS